MIFEEAFVLLSFHVLVTPGSQLELSLSFSVFTKLGRNSGEAPPFPSAVCSYLHMMEPSPLIYSSGSLTTVIELKT